VALFTVVGDTITQLTVADPKKLSGKEVDKELKFERHNKYCCPQVTLRGGWKLDAIPPAGKGEAIPVKPLQDPFQLQVIGAMELLCMDVHVLDV
jgi:hypothetical protein